MTRSSQPFYATGRSARVAITVSREYADITSGSWEIAIISVTAKTKRNPDYPIILTCNLSKAQYGQTKHIIIFAWIIRTKIFMH